jgi:hypothetical protein
MQFDKTLSVGVILAVAIQTGSFIWWAATLENRVTTIEAGRSDRIERFFRIEQITAQNATAITRLVAILDRMNEPPPNDFPRAR